MQPMADPGASIHTRTRRTDNAGDAMSRRAALLASIEAAAKAPQAAVALSGGSAGQPLRVQVSALPAGTGRTERWVLAGYTAGACLLYGTVMNLWFWPFGAGGASSIAYVAGAGLATNLRHFVAFDLATSLGFDVPRAVLNALLVLAVGAPVLVALRRAASRTALGPVAPERSEVAEAA